MPILPRTAALLTGLCVITQGIVRSPTILFGYVLAICVFLLWTQRRSEKSLAVALVKWSLPFIIPLLIIHGCLNSEFVATRHAFGFIPIRPDGFLFGLTIALQVLLLSIVGGFWISVPKDEFVESLIRLRLPSWSLLLLMQSAAIAGTVSRRISAVYLAQRARGIPVSGSFISRVRAFPSVLMPVVIGTLIEAEERVPSLVNRGFGSVAPLPTARQKFSSSEFLLTLSCLLLSVTAIILDRSR